MKHKIGESAGKVDVHGISVRASRQVQKLNKESGYDRYAPKIIKTYEDKATARTFETKLIDSIRDQEGANTLPGNRTNR